MQEGKPEGKAQAAAWQQAAQAWRRRTAQRFPHYRDVLGPMVLALHELHRGLDVLLAASEARNVPEAAASQLMLFPPAPGEQALQAGAAWRMTDGCLRAPSTRCCGACWLFGPACHSTHLSAACLCCHHRH